MSFYKIPALFLLLFIASATQGQPFLQQAPANAQTLKEVQRQFNDWKKGRDLSKTKHWKYFKRMEMDMQLHTDPTGEPVNPAIYINEVVKAANEKEQLANARMALTSWYPVGPSVLPDNKTGYMENGLGRINCIAFHPNSPATYFVGVAQGGVWKTSNNGQTWTPLTDNLPITRISDISIDPNNPDVMYISVCDFAYIGAGLFLDGRKRNTHYGLGVYKTTNGGQTWAPTGLSFQLTNGDASLIKKILVNPANSNNLVAAGASGMYLSSDAGATWTNTLDSLFWDMVQHPTDPNILYAATGWVKSANAGHAAIYKSTNFGNTWTMLNTGIPGTGQVQRIKLAIAPSNPDYVYAIAVNTESGLYGFYKTTNAGTTWQFSNPGVNVLDGNQGAGNGGQGNYDLALMVSNSNPDLVFTGGVNIWGSEDGAQTFNPVSHWTTFYGPTLHGDIHYMVTQPQTGNIFVVTDGGVYRTTNMVISTWLDAGNGVAWPTFWTNLNDGLAVTSFYRISSSRNSTGRIVAGSQDNATAYFDGSNWSTIFGGDGMDNYLDPLDDFSIIGSSQYGNFYRSDNGGFNYFSLDANPFSEQGEWTSPIVADYNNHGTLYAGFENVYKTTDNGLWWTQISNFPSGFNASEISALAVSNANPDVLYAAKRVRYEHNIPGKIYISTNGGNNWTDATAGLPDSLYYTSIELHETSATTAFVTMAGFSAGHKVYKTTDNGATWENISYNLPNIPVNCAKYIPGGDAIMLATDLGVYVLRDGETTWENESLGLPNVIVSDIEINPELGEIYIATFGRGIWATDLGRFITDITPDIVAGGIQLYPTLNNGTFTLDFSKAIPNAQQVCQVEIVDVKGRTVYKSALSGKTNYLLNLQIRPGMYFAKIEVGGVVDVKKFVVR